MTRRSLLVAASQYTVKNNVYAAGCVNTVCNTQHMSNSWPGAPGTWGRMTEYLSSSGIMSTVFANYIIPSGRPSDWHLNQIPFRWNPGIHRSTNFTAVKFKRTFLKNIEVLGSSFQVQFLIGLHQSWFRGTYGKKCLNVGSEFQQNLIKMDFLKRNIQILLFSVDLFFQRNLLPTCVKKYIWDQINVVCRS